MQKIKFSSYTLQFVLLVFIVLLFTECRNNVKFQRDVNTFIATLFFFVVMLVSGVPAIVFSAISTRSSKTSMQVLAIVFVSVFALSSLISIPLFQSFWQKEAKDWIAFIAVVQYGSLALSIILIVVGVKSKNKRIQNSSDVTNTIESDNVKEINSDNEIDYLDEILNN